MSHKKVLSTNERANKLQYKTQNTEKYNTELSILEEAAFQSWLKAESRKSRRDMSRDLENYDWRGFWKNGGELSNNGHATDRYKKPNHPTFSEESQYNNIDGNRGGKWIEDEKGALSFLASETNLKHHSKEFLQDYFKKREVAVTLVIPESNE